VYAQEKIMSQEFSREQQLKILRMTTELMMRELDP
jgi:hypothetical protein